MRTRIYKMIIIKALCVTLLSISLVTIVPMLNDEVFVQAKTKKPEKVLWLNVDTINKTTLLLEWDALSRNCTGYQIYRSVKGKSGYKKIATVKGRKKHAYRDKKLKENATYYYKVRAVNKSIKGKFSYVSHGKTSYDKVTDNECILINDIVFCTDGVSFYKYNVSNAQLSVLIDAEGYVSNVQFDGVRYIYFGLHGNGSIYNGRIIQYDTYSNSFRVLITNANYARYLLDTDGIYYTFADYDTLENRTLFYDLKTGKTKRVNNMELEMDCGNMSNTQDYKVVIQNNVWHPGKSWLRTPGGLVVLDSEYYTL